MENSNGFERYSSSWKKAGKGSISQQTYSENDINKFKMNKSMDFSRALNKTIWFDFTLKGLLLIGMIALAWIYHTNAAILSALVLLIGVSIYLIVKENSIRSEFGLIDDLSEELSTVLKEKIKFYTASFPKLKWMIAFSNALFVWVGSMFYYYSKYGYYRIEDIEDAIVSAVMLSLAFGISYYTMTFQYKYYIHELNECLAQLSDEQSVAMTIKRQLWRKRVIMFISILAIALGLLLFAYLLMY
jgi:hypothetical protein